MKRFYEDDVAGTIVVYDDGKCSHGRAYGACPHCDKGPKREPLPEPKCRKSGGSMRGRHSYILADCPRCDLDAPSLRGRHGYVSKVRKDD